MPELKTSFFFCPHAGLMAHRGSQTWGILVSHFASESHSLRAQSCFWWCNNSSWGFGPAGSRKWTLRPCSSLVHEHQRIDASELWCWRRLLRVPLHPEGDQSWVFTGRTDAEGETPVLRPPDAKSRLIGKDPDAGKDWGQEKGVTEDETVGWHHQLNGPEFEQTLGDGEGQGSLRAAAHGVPKSWTQLSEWTTKSSRGRELCMVAPALREPPSTREGRVCCTSWQCCVGPASCRIVWDSHIQSFFSWFNL